MSFILLKIELDVCMSNLLFSILFILCLNFTNMFSVGCFLKSLVLSGAIPEIYIYIKLFFRLICNEKFGLFIYFNKSSSRTKDHRNLALISICCNGSDALLGQVLYKSQTRCLSLGVNILLIRARCPSPYV